MVRALDTTEDTYTIYDTTSSSGIISKALLLELSEQSISPTASSPEATSTPESLSTNITTAELSTDFIPNDTSSIPSTDLSTGLTSIDKDSTETNYINTSTTDVTSTPIDLNSTEFSEAFQSATTFTSTDSDSTRFTTVSEPYLVSTPHDAERTEPNETSESNIETEPTKTESTASTAVTEPNTSFIPFDTESTGSTKTISSNTETEPTDTDSTAPAEETDRNTASVPSDTESTQPTEVTELITISTPTETMEYNTETEPTNTDSTAVTELNTASVPFDTETTKSAETIELNTETESTNTNSTQPTEVTGPNTVSILAETESTRSTETIESNTGSTPTNIFITGSVVATNPSPDATYMDTSFRTESTATTALAADSTASGTDVTKPTNTDQYTYTFTVTSDIITDESETYPTTKTITITTDATRSGISDETSTTLTTSTISVETPSEATDASSSTSTTTTTPIETGSQGTDQSSTTSTTTTILIGTGSQGTDAPSSTSTSMTSIATESETTSGSRTSLMVTVAPEATVPVGTIQSPTSSATTGTGSSASTGTSVSMTVSSSTSTGISTVGVNTTSAITSTATTSTVPVGFCDNDTHVFFNGGCLSIQNATIATLELLNSDTNNGTAIAYALSSYISSISKPTSSLTGNFSWTPAEIDESLGKIKNINLTLKTTNSILIAVPLNQNNNNEVWGASFTRGIGGTVINSPNEEPSINSSVSAAAFITKEYLADATSLSMLIIDKPSSYATVGDSMNKKLASSVIVTSVERNISKPISKAIALYFQVLPGYVPTTNNSDYLCSFYNNHSRTWDESGCTKPQFNAAFQRYECNCNHLTSFALIWLPSTTTNLNSQDIASLVFQCISIICFVAIIIHAIVIRIRDPLMSLQAYELLPLISAASTTILFIFYIALTTTVYTKTSPADQTECFLSSTVLMFFVYFFMIFMFCTKTSVGYFNYLRFVLLFPDPSYRKLVRMLVISFFISITWVSFAAGFHSNPSFNITHLIPYKLCWFSRNAIYYFLTIPAGLFIVINLLIFILVAIRIIDHVRNATSPHQSYKRMERSVLVLLASCFTQGIGWLFGPFITIVSERHGHILGWFFIIFNGLEGIWAIILYMIIRAQHMDEQKRILAYKELRRSTTSSFKKLHDDDLNATLTRRFDVINGDPRDGSLAFDGSFDTEPIDRYTSAC